MTNTRVIVMLFATYFNGDELPEFLSDDLSDRGAELGSALLRAQGRDARDAAQLLSAMMNDLQHPLFAEIEMYSLVGWNGELDLHEKFREIAAAAIAVIAAELPGERASRDTQVDQ